MRILRFWVPSRSRPRPSVEVSQSNSWYLRLRCTIQLFYAKVVQLSQLFESITSWTETPSSAIYSSSVLGPARLPIRRSLFCKQSSLGGCYGLLSVPYCLNSTWKGQNDGQSRTETPVSHTASYSFEWGAIHLDWDLCIPSLRNAFDKSTRNPSPVRPRIVALQNDQTRLYIRSRESLFADQSQWRRAKDLISELSMNSHSHKRG